MASGENSREKKGLMSADNDFGIVSPFPGPMEGRRKRNRGKNLEKKLFPEVLPQVFMDKLNPGILLGPEGKSPGAVMFQRHHGGKGEGEHAGEERDNGMERMGMSPRREEG